MANGSRAGSSTYTKCPAVKKFHRVPLKDPFTLLLVIAVCLELKIYLENYVDFVADEISELMKNRSVIVTLRNFWLTYTSCQKYALNDFLQKPHSNLLRVVGVSSEMPSDSKSYFRLVVDEFSQHVQTVNIAKQDCRPGTVSKTVNARQAEILAKSRQKASF